MSKKIFIITALFLLPSLATAQAINNPKATNYGLDSNFSQVGISSRSDLKGTIASVINIGLGFLGIIAVIFIMIGGFRWMTAAGNEDQVQAARRTIVQAASGLAIVFAAWIIASYAINALKDATGVDGTGAPNQTTSNPAGAPAPGASTGSPTDAGNSSLSAGALGQLINPGLSSPVNELTADAGVINSGYMSVPPIHAAKPAGTPDTTDTDGDGLTDNEEVSTYLSNPNNPDTDGDGYIDGVEANNGFSPTGLTQSCGSLVSILAEALGNQAKLAEAQIKIKNCCAQTKDPLCQGL